jgi:acyl-CoA thioesterase
MSNTASNYIENDIFAKNLGIELVEKGNESAVCKLKITEDHKNGLGSLHGAVIFSLADVAFAAACNTNLTAIGIQAGIKYLNQPDGNILIAEASAISCSNKIGHYQVNIKDEAGTKIACFEGTAYRFPQKN